MSIRYGAVELRFDANGALDEVVTDRFHLERMSDRHWWMLIDGHLHVDLMTSERSRAKITADWRDESDDD